MLEISGANSAGSGVATPEAAAQPRRRPSRCSATRRTSQADVTGIPAAVELTIDARGPDGPADPDQNTKVHVDADHAIGQVLIRATDGQAPPADPADNGVVYQDQPGEPYAVIAKVDGFKSVRTSTHSRSSTSA